jgi:hypothetical protein
LTGNTKVLHLWLTQRLVFSCQRACATRQRRVRQSGTRARAPRRDISI